MVSIASRFFSMLIVLAGLVGFKNQAAPQVQAFPLTPSPTSPLKYK